MKKDRVYRGMGNLVPHLEEEKKELPQHTEGMPRHVDGNLECQEEHATTCERECRSM